jgi:hypothetical protein
MTRDPSDRISTKVHFGHPFFDIIEEAYEVFAGPKPKTTGVCEQCCMDSRIEADFFNPKISELPLDYVRDWYQGAYKPGGVPKDTWAYLLPRVLEILALGEEVSNVGLEVSLSRFSTGDSRNWSDNEWAVLDSFQRMYLRHYIEHERGQLDDAICMFRLGGWPLEVLMEQVASVADETLAQRLWHDWCSWHAPGCQSVWITSFWEGSDSTSIFRFYTSREFRDRMEALALADDTEAELATKASAVVSVIEASADWSH